MTFIKILICPKCNSQGNEGDYEESAHSERCGFSGDLIDFDFSLLEPTRRILERRDSLLALARFKLAQIEREDAFIQAARDWYRNLSVVDRFWEDSRRKRIHREKLAALSPRDRAFRSMMHGWQNDLVRQLYSRGSLLDLTKDPRLKPDALDIWLSEDGRIPEVVEALEL